MATTPRKSFRSDTVNKRELHLAVIPFLHWLSKAMEGWTLEFADLEGKVCGATTTSRPWQGLLHNPCTTEGTGGAGGYRTGKFSKKAPTRANQGFLKPISSSFGCKAPKLLSGTANTNRFRARVNAT